MAASSPDWVYDRVETDRAIVRDLAPGITAHVFPGSNSMLSLVTADPHSEGQIHSHPEEQWGVLLEGECIRIQDGRAVAMTEGNFWHTPGGTDHGIRTAETGAVILDVFSPPRPDYQSHGEGYGDGAP